MQMRAELKALLLELGTTTIYVTHDQTEALSMGDRIAVMNRGHIVQVDTPLEVYDKPANDFVMGFVGPVTQLGGETVRPHDFDLFHEPTDGAVEAQVERIVPLGFEVRVELVLGDSSPLTVQLTRMESELLELQPGEIVYARPRSAPSRPTCTWPRATRATPD